MAYSYYIYPGTGSQTQFNVAFDYIRREHVAVTVNGVAASFTWVNSALIQMDTAPANGASVRVYRETPLSAPLVDFADGSTLVAADLDTNAKQSIYTQQELDDTLIESVIPNGDKGDITTSSGGTVWTIDAGAVVEAKLGTGAVTEAKLGTGAVTSAKIADGTIANADINASAAIAATKLAFTPAGNIAATTVQAAIEELDTEKGRPIFSYTPVASTSGTAITFTGIPTFAKQITVNLVGVATTGTSEMVIRLGTAADGIISSGYVGSSLVQDSVSTVESRQETTGFSFYRNIRNYAVSSTINIVLQGVSGSNYTWIASGNFYLGTAHTIGCTVGSKIVTSAVDQVSITTTGGVNTFNAGSISVSYRD
jgi:hypothetical protein